MTTYLRVDEEFLLLGQVDRYMGDPDHVPGAVSLIIDGVELLGTDLWDDVNWFWPLLVRAADEYRTSGFGKRGFPDQPISFSLESAWPGTALVRVFDGDEIDRSATIPDDELFREIARVGTFFFDELQRLCPGTSFGSSERPILDGWHM